MSRHHSDLLQCRRQPGITIGKLCDKCDERCVICDSYIRQTKLVYICDQCNYGQYNSNRCILCNSGNAYNNAYYCYECCMLEKDRDGCPKIINIGTNKSDLFYEKQKYKQKTTL